MRRAIALTAAAAVVLTAFVVPTLVAAEPGYASVAAKARKPRPTPAPTTTSSAPTTTTTPPDGAPVFTGDFETGDFSQYSTCQTRLWNSACASMPAGYPLSIVAGHRGNYAARFEVRDGDMPFCCGERAQLVADTHETEGTEFWYTWSYKLDPQFPVVDTWQTLLQWHSTVDGSPPLAWYAYGNQIILQTRPRPNAPYTGLTNIWSTPLVKDVWVDVKMHVKWSADPNVGYAELWVNGVRQNFTATPPENGNGTSCVAQPVCRFSDIYPGDPGNRLMATYYRDPAITATGVVYQDDITVTTP